MGQTLCRLVEKCGEFCVVQSASATLAPLQLGYGIPSDCEAAARATHDNDQ